MPKENADIAAPIDAGIEQAATAVRVFQTMCPELSVFASVLVGRDPEGRSAIKVKAGPVTCTDGRIIYIRPDARLSRAFTDEDWSDIKAGLFHEVAHIAFDSFAAVLNQDRLDAIDHVTSSMEDSLRRDALLREFEKAAKAAPDAEGGINYKGLSSVFHPLMPMLVNALEDARVEHLLFQAKPGTHKHLERQRTYIFDAPREEIVARIGTPWNERPADSQMIIGCYLLGAGYAPEGRLSESAATDLRTIEPLVLAAVGSLTINDVYARSFAVLTALQELGYLRNGDERDAEMGETPHEQPEPGTALQRAQDSGCPHPKSKIVPCSDERCKGNCTQCGAHIISVPQPEDGDGEEGDGNSSGEGDSKDTEAADRATAAPAGPTPPGTATEPGDGDTRPAGTGTGEGEEGAARITEAEEITDDDDEIAPAPRTIENESEESVSDALSEAGGHDHEHSSKDDSLSDRGIERAVTLIDEGYAPGEQPATGVNAIRHRRLGKHSYMWSDRPERIDSAQVEQAVATVMPELRQVLALNGLTGFTGGMRSGRVDTRALSRTAVGDSRVFGRFETAESRDYQFVLALDCSGSMGHGSRVENMKITALAAAEMLDRLGVPFLIFGYSGNSVSLGWELEIADVRMPGDPWDKAARTRLLSLDPHSANLDGSSMQYARVLGRTAARSPETEVVVLYFNDGGMPAENEYAEKPLIRWEVANQRRNRAHYVGVGISSSAVEAAGLELVECNEPVSGARNITAKIAEVLGVRR